MLTRVFKPNHGGLQDLARQFLIWTLNKRKEFHCSAKSSYFHPAEDVGDDDYKKRVNQEKFTSRPRNNNFWEDGFNRDSYRKKFGSRPRYNKFWGDHADDNEWTERSWHNANYKRNSFSKSNWNHSSFQRKEQEFTFSEELKPCNKDFYKPHPDVLNRSEDFNEFCKNHSINLFGNEKDKCPGPILNFHELDVPDQTLNLMRSMGYSNPTPIQSIAWPVALSGHNLVGISRTGSGKTLGFLLPAMVHIQHQVPLSKGEGPIALIVSPTRELGQQIVNVAKPFADSFKLRFAKFFGGARKDDQLNRFGNGAEICVCTPGRIIDVLNEGSINLSRCTYIVLDEADRLLDMGFSPQIEEILYRSRKDKQVLMFSATWPKEVWQLAETYLKDYIAVKFGSMKLEVNPNITQIIHVCHEREKRNLLNKVIDEIFTSENKKTLIFAKTKRTVDRIGYYLKSKRLRVSTIHGDKSQNFRNRTMSLFRSGNIDILVGTLVVSRGLDIVDIGNVINFDFPGCLEDYVHIIGRTARAENSGIAHSFFTRNDASCARGLIDLLESANQEVCPQLRTIF